MREREREREGDPMREGGTHGRQADRQADRQRRERATGIKIERKSVRERTE